MRLIPKPVERLGFVPKSLTQHPHPDDMRPLAEVMQQAAPPPDRESREGREGVTAPNTTNPTTDPTLTFYQAPGTHTPVCVLLGPGGTGKTYRIQKYQQDNEDEKVLLTATTGVAAINIGPTACTINSAMKFFSEETLKENLTKPYVMDMVRSSFAPLTLLVIDEVSMLSSGILEKIYDFIESINRDRAARGSDPLKLLLSGDFCQLPPVVEGAVPFAFHARQWEKAFEPAIVKLTKNYRQSSDPDFQRALHRCRIGDSAGAINDLKCNYSKMINYDFPGLTLYSINKEVEAHNTKKLRELPGDPFYDIPQKWGEQLKKEWDSIPDPLIVKIGAQIRVTANLSNQGHGSSFVYVNGDIGILKAYESGKYATVELNRGGTVSVDPVTRMNFKPLGLKERPPEFCNGKKVPHKFTGQDRAEYEAYIVSQSMKGRSWYHPKERKWVIGEIRFIPIMLGFASSVHRSQGLTLSQVQIDIRPQFSGSPQMMYVALSRCTSASGIFIARGDQHKLQSRISVHREVVKYV